MHDILIFFLIKVNETQKKKQEKKTLIKYTLLISDVPTVCRFNQLQS